MSFYSFDLNKTGILQSPVHMICAGSPVKITKEVMLDYGAGTCHMTFPLWKELGFANIYFEEFKNLFASKSINSLADLTFENLHMRRAKRDTELGNGMEVPAYIFRLDALILY